MWRWQICWLCFLSGIWDGTLDMTVTGTLLAWEYRRTFTFCQVDGKVLMGNAPYLVLGYWRYGTGPDTPLV